MKGKYEERKRRAKKNQGKNGEKRDKEEVHCVEGVSSPLMVSSHRSIQSWVDFVVRILKELLKNYSALSK